MQICWDHFAQFASLRAERLWSLEQDRTFATSSISWAPSSLPPLPSLSPSSHDTLPFDVVLPAALPSSSHSSELNLCPEPSANLSDFCIATEPVTLHFSLQSDDIPLRDESFPNAQRSFHSATALSSNNGHSSVAPGAHDALLQGGMEMEEDLYPPYIPVVTRAIFFDEQGCLGVRQYPNLTRASMWKDFYRGWGFVPKYVCNMLCVPAALKRLEEKPGSKLLCILLPKEDGSFARPFCLINDLCQGDFDGACIDNFRASFCISEMCLRWSADIPRFLDGHYLFPCIDRRPVPYREAASVFRGAYIYFATSTLFGFQRPIERTPPSLPACSYDASFYEDLDDLQLGTSLRPRTRSPVRAWFGPPPWFVSPFGPHVLTGGRPVLPDDDPLPPLIRD